MHSLGPALPRLTSFIIILLMVSAVASVLVNATGPKAGDPLSYTTGGERTRGSDRFRSYVWRGTCSENELTAFEFQHPWRWTLQGTVAVAGFSVQKTANSIRQPFTQPTAIGCPQVLPLSLG